jgi:Ca-activated chloride channel family protein
LRVDSNLIWNTVYTMVELVTVSIVCLVILAEWLHARRCRRVACIAFGPGRRPAEIMRVMSLFRIGAAGAFAWGLLTLYALPSAAKRPNETQSVTHMVFALDVSPSMNLSDSGLDGKLSRARRARDVVQSILERTDLSRVKISILGFYGSARPVAVDVVDQEVIANILDDLPIDLAFKNGKTDLYSSLEGAAKISMNWKPGSAFLFVLSDGDTLPKQTMKKLSAAYAKSYVLGFGSPYKGSFIDGHSSRQFQAELQQFAMKTNSTFWDANQKHLPSELLPDLPGVRRNIMGSTTSSRGNALWALSIGIILLGLISPVLALMGRPFPPRSELNRRKAS